MIDTLCHSSDLFHELNVVVTDDLYAYDEDMMLPLLRTLIERVDALDKDESEVSETRSEDAHPLNTNIGNAMAKLGVAPLPSSSSLPRTEGVAVDSEGNSSDEEEAALQSYVTENGAAIQAEIDKRGGPLAALASLGL